jgi:L-threonylcarbamoyladenylate synthase
MLTEVIKINPDNIDEESIFRAAKLLTRGELVAIPTETVYGLAANALDKTAVEAIFSAKGRPQDNPLIVHLADKSWLLKYALDIPRDAYKLIEAFWPGPLTIILKKSLLIPDVVSAGLDTAAFRLPSHPVARAIIEKVGLPLAAPSANISGSPSPTTAAHVLSDLGGRIAAIVDGGECSVGVESTVVSLCGEIPTVLRPGGVTTEMLREVIGNVVIDRAVLNGLEDDAKASSPGMKYKHYSPKAHVVIIKGELSKIVNRVNAMGEGATMLCFDGEEAIFNLPCVTYGAREDSAEQARRLFDALRRLDDIGAKTVYARCPAKTGMGLAVYNRLLRAAGFEVIEV